MNVLHLLDERWDSGLTAYGLNAAEALRARGHRVSLATRPGSPAERAGRERGFPLCRMTLSALGRWVRRERVDVVNAHTGAGHTAGFLATRFTSAALVRTRAEATHKNVLPGDNAPLLEVRPGQSFLYRRTDGVAAASRALGDALEHVFPFVRERLAVIAPGVGLPPRTPEPEGPLRVGLLGRLDPVKGHRYFLEAVALLKDRSAGDLFLIAGEEKNVSRAELEAQAEQWGISDRVRFLGRVADAGEFLRSCHIGVVSSVGSEAVSRAALEWMAQGRPLVATAVGALPEVVLSGDNGFVVPPRSSPGLARVLRVLLEDGALRRRMGERARKTVESHFSMERLGEDTETLYAAALRHRRGGR